MPLLQANFSQVDDKFIDLPAKIYTLRVIGVKREASKNPDVLAKDPGATNLIVDHEVIEDADYQGRKKSRHISLKMLTEIKRLAMSCGITKDKIEKEGLDPEAELPGKTCRAEVRPNVYQDSKTGAMRENSQIANYLIPGDQGYSV